MKLIKTLIVICFIAFPAFAQNESENLDDFLKAQNQSNNEAPAETLANPSETEIEKSLAEAKAENKDQEILGKKLELAKKMHQIRPTRDQIDSAVRSASLALPENERQGFVTAMGTILNYNAIERISIDAMVETYTLNELESMVEYFSKPEAMSASRKIGVWAQEVQPEIGRMIDKAMIRLRTGR